MSNIRLAVGSNGKVLTARSAEASGLKWEVPGGGTGVWTTLIKTGDESTNTDTTFSDDDTLFFTTSASTAYAVHIVVYGTANTTPDIKFQVHHTGTTSRYLLRRWSQHSGAASAMSSVTTETTVTIACTTGGAFYLEYWLELDVGGSGGTLSLQWAQNTSDGNNSTVFEGSFLEYQAV